MITCPTIGTVTTGETFTVQYKTIDVVRTKSSDTTKTVTVTWTYGALNTSVDMDNNNPLKPETFGEFIADIYRTLAAETTYYADRNLQVNFGFSIATDKDGDVDYVGNKTSNVSVSDTLGLLMENGKLNEAKLADFINKNGALDGDGVLKFRGNEFTYVSDVSEQLASFLKIDNQTKQDGSYGTSYDYNWIYRAGTDNINEDTTSDLQAEYTFLNERNSRLENFSIGTSQTIYYVVHTHNTFVQDFTGESLDEATLATHNGNMVDLDDAFKYDNNQRGSNINNQIDSSPVHTYTIGIAWTTGETLQQYEDKVHSTLASLYNSINALRTSEPLNIDAAYDVQFSVNAENGKLSFTGNEFTYIDHIGNQVGDGVTGAAATDGSDVHGINVAPSDTSISASSVLYNGGVKNENIINTKSILENEIHVQENSTGTYGKSYTYNINYRPDTDTVQEKTYINLRNTEFCSAHQQHVRSRYHKIYN